LIKVQFSRNDTWSASRIRWFRALWALTFGI
jgi:hypothetical protein